MEMTKGDFLELLDVAEIDTDAFREKGYSGRGMYGRSCPGVDLDNFSGLVLLMVAAGRMAEARDLDDDQTGERFDAEEFARTVCTDSMGMGIIVYWPSLTLND